MTEFGKSTERLLAKCYKEEIQISDGKALFNQTHELFRAEYGLDDEEATLQACIAVECRINNKREHNAQRSFLLGLLEREDQNPDSSLLNGAD